MKAIVTLAIGQRYQDMWHQIARPSWEIYAARHDYELVCIDAPIAPDPHQRSVHWQKLLLARYEPLRRFDRLVWMDSDIVINPDAPCILAALPEDKIGVVLSGELQDPRLRPLYVARWAQYFMKGDVDAARNFWAQYYARAGLAGDPEIRFNTGVMAFSPARHGDFFRAVFDTHTRRAFDWEQTALSYELARSGLAHHLDPRFNTEVGAELLKYHPHLFWLDENVAEVENSAFFQRSAYLALNAILMRSWFLHFCGAHWPCRFLGGVVTPPQDFRAAMREFSLGP